MIALYGLIKQWALSFWGGKLKCHLDAGPIKMGLIRANNRVKNVFANCQNAN